MQRIRNFRTVEDAGPYKVILSFSVGAIHESPVFYLYYAFVFREEAIKLRFAQ